MLIQKRGDIFELSLRARASEIGRIEVLKEVLVNTGVATNDIVESEQWPYTYLLVYSNLLSKARAIQQKLRAYRLIQVPVTVKILKKKDWQTKWKEDFRPFHLTKTFGVIPLRFKGKRQLPGKTPIYLDTDLAFGTGLHATTRFMAGFVDRCRGQYDSFLDLGTGTGILAIMASKCGAGDVIAIDICKDAVKVAKQNCQTNSCQSIHIKMADAYQYRTKRQYDFVCANIITRDLIEMGPKLVSLVRPGKYLAVSGISLNSYNVFREAYAKYPLRCLKVEKGEGWVALLYKKSGVH